MKHAAAVPRGERPGTQALIHRGGCVSGPYALWMERLGVGSPEAVQERLAESDISPITDTAGRASDERYNRPTNHEAYLCLKSSDARHLFDQIE